jgi:hypothetical protein
MRYDAATKLNFLIFFQGICMEYVLESGRRFGILNACDHTFCLGCIRHWRSRAHDKRENGRACPLCRVDSFYVVPSDRLVTDPDRKDALIQVRSRHLLRSPSLSWMLTLAQVYRGKLSAIPCAHFSETGECPFGSSCFYKHVNKDGSVVSADGKTSIRHRFAFYFVCVVSYPRFLRQNQPRRRSGNDSGGHVERFSVSRARDMIESSPKRAWASFLTIKRLIAEETGHKVGDLAQRAF